MQVRFDPSHPPALAIYCSDGRFTGAVEDLCEHLGHQRLDTMTMPGGPALLTNWPADLSEVHVFSGAARFLIEGHKISNVILLAHEGCGFYRTRCGTLSAPAIKKLQVSHLQAARTTLLRHFPNLTVTCSYAAVAETVITFEDIAA